MDVPTLRYQLRSLSVFRSLLDRPALRAAEGLLDALVKKDGLAALDAWGALWAALQADGASGLADWLWTALEDDEGPWPRAREAGQTDSPLESAARRDLEILSALAQLDSQVLRDRAAALLPGEVRSAARDLPLWAPGSLSEPALVQRYLTHGCGRFARYRAFLWEGDRLLPVAHPDSPGPEALIGYRRQRSQVEANTRILLHGRRANNVLLFGESGTGKSATVKSLLALPHTDELRLIEIEKDSVGTLPRLIRSLGDRRQKFILFIDDLAFDQDDDTYGVLKTILEGGLEPRPDNVAIYATSNRRNLVRQTFSDRAGDEVDREETIQEKTALADRFGLRVLYQGLTMKEYLELVAYLAGQDRLTLAPQELEAQARAWDVRHPGRSPRSARQFVDSLH